MEEKKVTEKKKEDAMTREDFAVLWKTIHLKITDTYDVPPEILWVNGSTIGTLGNFSASTGKAKSKKTFNISAIVAAALKNDEVLQYSAFLPENKRKILYVDTEQSKYHCHKVMERIMRLAGLPTDKDREDFIFVVLRECTPDKRKQIIGYMLANMEGIGLVIIDGIRDLMYDINSPSESSDLINLLMRWSSEYNLHIHTVLHLNKGDDNTRGHIGTELNNKAETVLEITKSTQDVDISEVKAMHIRDKDFEPFAFRINETALPEVVKDYVFEQPKQNRNFPLTELTEQQHREAWDDNTRGHIGTELNNKAETVLEITKSTQDVDISEVKAMHIRDKDFEPFAFRINETALPEVVKDYVFEQPKQNRNFPLTELTEQQHREALENGFGKDVVQGYPNVIAALKKGYASIGFERGRNILVDLNKFLVNKRMIIKEGKGYKFNSDFHY